ncbi:hypothetical protein QN416_24630, partial [Glaciimonas sp. Cout2]|uniref:hypothetical protein n=1 Tax=Glaciimonas sp. Cout2 TaxID=3048621 RepID=UPI002B23914B
FAETIYAMTTPNTQHPTPNTQHPTPSQRLILKFPDAVPDQETPLVDYLLFVVLTLFFLTLISVFPLLWVFWPIVTTDSGLS